MAREADPQGIGIAINPMTAPLRDTLLRLLSLLDTADGWLPRTRSHRDHRVVGHR
jgi:hypothetical protein